MKKIVIAFGDNGEIILEKEDCTLADVLFASKVLERDVDASLNMASLKENAKILYSAVKEAENEYEGEN